MTDTKTLYALQDHAKKLYPIAAALALGIVTELEPRGWTKQRRWTNCYSIHRGAKQFHFRYNRNPWRIDVYNDLPQNGGKIVAVLASTVDVFKWIRKVAYGR